MSKIITRDHIQQFLLQYPVTNEETLKEFLTANGLPFTDTDLERILGDLGSYK